MGVEALGLYAALVALEHVDTSVLGEFCGVPTAAGARCERHNMLGHQQTHEEWFSVPFLLFPGRYVLPLQHGSDA